MDARVWKNRKPNLCSACGFLVWFPYKEYKNATAVTITIAVSISWPTISVLLSVMWCLPNPPQAGEVSAGTGERNALACKGFSPFPAHCMLY